LQLSNLGNTGLMVSRLAFGAMTFGEGTLVGELKSHVGQALADRMVARCLDAGVNFFDTADMYTSGQSETILGKALGKRRGEAVIATKCGFRAGPAPTAVGLSYRHILESVEASLRRLGTDWIDVFLLHIPDPHTPVEETARALDDLVRRGHVRYAGYSNFRAWHAQRMLDHQRARGLAPLICGQLYYSLLGRDIEEDHVPFLEANGLGLMVWSPLASGFLSGKYTRGRPVPPDARRAKFDFPPIDVERGYDVVEKLSEIGRARGASVAQTALAWVLAKPFVSTVLVGANTMEQLEDNLKAADAPALALADVKALDERTALAPRYPAWMVPMGADDAIAKGLARS
jgi:aryl-alcohol dehydrogenase-like predicted oxidoreductase